MVRGAAEATKTAEPAAQAGARSGEFAAGWPVLLATILGIGFGVIALPGPAIGVFMRDLQAEFGWSRAEISLGPTIMIAGLALSSPAIGWIADRVSSVLIAAFSLAALAAAFFLMSRLGPSLLVYYLGFGLFSIAASGSSALIYARVLSASFTQNRGLALGIAMTGNGLAGILLPMLLVPYVASEGWRAGSFALGVVVLFAMPIVSVLLAYGSRPLRRTVAELPAQNEVSFRQVLGDPVFWQMAACFALIPLALTGLHLHLVAIVGDAGVDPVSAGRIASLGGVALLITRLATGWLIDHAFAPRVAAAMMIVSAASVGAMAVLGPSAAWLGAIAFGLAIGAELDLLGYMTARYFGLGVYGRVYGLLYAFVLVGSTLSPVVYGTIMDATQSYQPALFAAAATLVLCAILFLTMRRFGTAGPAPRGRRTTLFVAGQAISTDRFHPQSRKQT